MKYEIDVQDKEIFVKGPQGHWASHKNYTQFLEVFKIFIEPTTESINLRTLIFKKKSLIELTLNQRDEINSIFEETFGKYSPSN